VTRKLELVGKSASHILLTTEQEAQELRRQAEADCADLRAQAEADAKDIRDEADTYAKQARARADADEHRGGDDARNGKPPGEQPKPVVRWRGEDRLAVLGDQPVLDLTLRLARGDPAGDHALDLLRRRGIGLIQGRAADGAHHLALELGLRRMLLARARDRRSQQRCDEHDEQQFHDAAICRR
jgi:hypothetical protein